MKVNWCLPVEQRDFNRVGASLWIRCLQLIPYLESMGLQCTVNQPETDADICVFVRWQDRHAFELARRQAGRGQKIVFDLAVNYFDKCRVAHLGRVVTSRHRKNTLRMLSVADAVTCCSRNIADHAAKFHARSRYIPDSINRDHFRECKSAEDFARNRPRVIWSGTSAKSRELEAILPMLAERDIELVVIADRAPRLRLPGRLWRRRFPNRFLHWQYETFPQRILDGELCVSHRPVDTPYNRGHSLFKIGVFLAQGVPAIASPVPSYAEVLGDGRAGRICETLADWERALDDVLANPNLLSRWSVNAGDVIKPYLTATVVKEYYALFRKLGGEVGA